MGASVVRVEVVWEDMVVVVVDVSVVCVKDDVTDEDVMDLVVLVRVPDVLVDVDETVVVVVIDDDVTVDVVTVVDDTLEEVADVVVLVSDVIV